MRVRGDMQYNPSDEDDALWPWPGWCRWQDWDVESMTRCVVA